jgi:hypothetical protein
MREVGLLSERKRNEKEVDMERRRIKHTASLEERISEHARLARDRAKKFPHVRSGKNSFGRPDKGRLPGR